MSSLSKYIGFPMQLNSTPSLLFCHSIFLGVGVDEITDLIAVSDPQQTGESANNSTLGTSVKQRVEILQIGYFEYRLANVIF